jgi:hypothetical protein
VEDMSEKIGSEKSSDVIYREDKETKKRALENWVLKNQKERVGLFSA